MTATDTITAAAREDGFKVVLPFSDSLRESVCAAVQTFPHGSTAEEISGIVGCSLNCARSRLTELKLSGHVRAIGRWPNQKGDVRITVWEAVR